MTTPVNLPTTAPAASPDLMRQAHTALGATLAGDGIPLHYGNRAAEYESALNDAVLMDRSHEGRLRLDGRDRLTLPDRISTNAVEKLQVGECTPTLFLTPNARILDRTTICNVGDYALLLTEPGRGEAVQSYLKRNTFYNDEMSLSNVAPQTRQFVLFGVKAGEVASALGVEIAAQHAAQVIIAEAEVTFIHDKPLGGDTANDVWRLVVPQEQAEAVWSAVLAAGAGQKLRPAGSLTYHALRVRSGRPGVNSELNGDHIPLEVGLWDEISFTKGCYTGQEIIARMDSRRRLAKTILRIQLDGRTDTPAPIMVDGRNVGTVTSAVETPRGEHLGIAVVKLAYAKAGAVVTVGEGISATLLDRAGVQPELQEE